MRPLLVLLLAAAALAAAAPAALGDADLPSDVLLLQSAYYPYQPPVSDRLRRTLDGLVAQSQKAGYPVKVAMVQSQVDLGDPAAVRPAGRLRAVPGARDRVQDEGPAARDHAGRHRHEQRQRERAAGDPTG